MRSAINYLLILVLISCGEDENSEPITDTASHVEYFGFTLIDTYWDDPTDTEAKSNYADEVSGFSNLADLLVVNPSDDITERVASFSNLELRAVIHLNELFFEYVDANGPSGANYDLRPNYESRWDEFTAINQDRKSVV